MAGVGRRVFGGGHGGAPVGKLDEGDVGVDGPHGLGDAGPEAGRERLVGGDRLAGVGVAQLLEGAHDCTSS